MNEIQATKIAEGLIFGEGIRWDNGHLVLSDMLGKRVVRINPESGQMETLLEVEQQPNGMVVLGEDHYLIASMFDSLVLEWKSGTVTKYADLRESVTGYLGDMVMDNHGNLFVDDVGARVLHGEKPAPGRLIRIAKDGRQSIVREGIAFPNGIVISASGQRFYLAETMTSTIWEHILDDKGNLSAQREVVNLSDYSRIDGMTMDSDDGIWACMLDRDCVIRFTPDGEKTDQVVMPGFEPIAATIGGNQQDTLYVTAIRALGGKNIFEEMMAGRVRASLFKAALPYHKGLCRP